MKILVVGSHLLAEKASLIFSTSRTEIAIAPTEAALKEQLPLRRWDIVLIDDDYFKSSEKKMAILMKSIRQAKKNAIILSSNHDFAHILKMKELGVADYVPKPFNEREFVMRVNAVVKKKTRIVCVGGGTGLFNLLMGLKKIPQVLLTSVVSMSDDGGSSGKLSQSLGLLPPGDIRRSLVALSNAPDIMNQIMQYRFDKKGELEGHSFGNIFLAALAGVKGTMSEAVRSLGDILYLQGIVLPSSKTMTKLVARFKSGALIEGESKIDRAEGRPADLRIVDLYHKPECQAETDAVAALIFSDFITIGPGDLFTSVITNLVIKDIRQAIVSSSAKKIYICNLMTKPGETSGFDAADHVMEVVRYLGCDALDYVLVSNTLLSKKALADYLRKDQVPVNLKNHEGLKNFTAAKIIVADLGDSRELVRHNSENLKNLIQELIGKK